MHIDEWIDRVEVPVDERYATFFFMLHRLPAIDQSVKWKEWIQPYKLFCTWKGEKYRVTGCSRLGDVWLTKDFKQETGYQYRVEVEECSNWTRYANGE